MAVKQSEVWGRILDQPFKDSSYTLELESGISEIKFQEGAAVVNVYTYDTTGTVTDHDDTKTYAELLAKIKNVNSSVNTYKLDQKKDFGQFLPEGVAKTNSAIKSGMKLISAIVSEQLLPIVDAYRLSILAATAVATGQVIAPTPNEGLKNIGELANKLFDAHLFKEGQVICYITPASALEIQTKVMAMLGTSGGEKSLRTGDIGYLHGVKLKRTPTQYFPTKVSAIMVNPGVVAAPRFIANTRVDNNPAGVFGLLAIGLFYYTCVVSKPREKGVAIIKSA